MPSKKYIFLDFDGPLNTDRNDYKDTERYGHHFDDMAVQNLRRIIDKTGALIVVSSSWRHLGIKKIREIWKEWGMPGEIAGCTPGQWNDDRIFNSRGEEIQAWLEENARDHYSYVIFDDLDFTEATLEQTFYWIQVDTRTGISNSDADEAIEILNRIDKEAHEAEIQKLFKPLVMIVAAFLTSWCSLHISNPGEITNEVTHDYPIPQPPIEDPWAKWADEIDALPDSIKQWIGFGGYPPFKIPDNLYQGEDGEWYTKEDSNTDE